MKTLDPKNRWMKLGNAIAIPFIIAAVPFIAALVIFETLTNKKETES